MSDRMLDMAEKRIAQLEAERDELRAKLTEIEAWRSRVREVVGVTDGFYCCCGDCEGDE